MPIDRSQYHPNFARRSQICLRRAKYTCQQCGRKRGEEFTAKSGRTEKGTIQAHHPNHDPMNSRAVLVALCEQCHLEADREYRAQRQHRTIRRKQRQALISAGQLELPLKFRKSKSKQPNNVEYLTTKCCIK